MRSRVQAFSDKLRKLLGAPSSEPRFAVHVPLLESELLEERRVLTVGLSALSPLSGTPNSTGGWDCIEPIVTGTVDGIESDHSFRVDIDFDGDGTADDSQTQSSGNATFQYDPRSATASSFGSFDLRVRATELDADGQTSLGSTDWMSLQMTVADPTPSVSLSQGGNTGDTYTFSGQVTGPYAAGSTVTFSGLLSGFATADANGNFSTTGTFPTGANGWAYVSITDTQNHTASNSLQIQIADPTQL